MAAHFRIKQFGAEGYSGFDTFLTHVIGDLTAILSCTTSVDKAESDGLTYYMLTLDPTAYTATDDLLIALAEYGSPVTEALFTVGFDGKGNVVSMNLALSFGDASVVEALTFSDLDSTVVDPAPETTIKYEEIDESIQKELKELMKELDAYAVSADGSSSSSAAA